MSLSQDKLRLPCDAHVCVLCTEWFICAPMAPIVAYLGQRNESQVGNMRRLNSC